MGLRSGFQEDDTKCDALTGLYQREVIYQYAESLIKNKTPFNYMILDIDNFKYINDNYGHRVGDVVLQTVAKQLTECIGEDGVIGRYGGDEFIFVVEGDLEYQEQWNLCFKMLRSTKPIEVDGHSISVTYTMGMAKYPKDAQTFEQLFDLVDKALYRGKTKGRDCFIIYVEEKHKDIFVKSIRDRSHSQMYLHTKLQDILFRNKNYEENIKAAIDYVASYLMVDMLYIQQEGEVKDLCVIPLSKIKEARPVEEGLLAEFFQNGSTYFVENSVVTSRNKDHELYRRLSESAIYSTVIVELRLYDRFYGYLRADMMLKGESRVWQHSEVTLLIELAQKLSFLYYMISEGTMNH